jgi:hypothetical protein
MRPRNAGVRDGTMSSNLLRSSGESGANLTWDWRGWKRSDDKVNIWADGRDGVRCTLSCWLERGIDGRLARKVMLERLADSCARSRRSQSR